MIRRIFLLAIVSGFMALNASPVCATTATVKLDGLSATVRIDPTPFRVENATSAHWLGKNVRITASMVYRGHLQQMTAGIYFDHHLTTGPLRSLVVAVKSGKWTQENMWGALRVDRVDRPAHANFSVDFPANSNQTVFLRISATLAIQDGNARITFRHPKNPTSDFEVASVHLLGDTTSTKARSRTVRAASNDRPGAERSSEAAVARRHPE